MKVAGHGALDALQSKRRRRKECLGLWQRWGSAGGYEDLVRTDLTIEDPGKNQVGEKPGAGDRLVTDDRCGGGGLESQWSTPIGLYP